MLTVLLKKKNKNETETEIETSQLTCEMWTNERETEVVWHTLEWENKKTNSRRRKTEKYTTEKMCKFVRVRLVQASSEQVPNVTRQETEKNRQEKKKN